MKTEDKSKELTGNAAKFVFVPIELITEWNNNRWLVAMYIYSQIRMGLDDRCQIVASDAVKWIGKKKNNNITGVNTKMSAAMYDLIELGYVKKTEEKSWYQVIPEMRTGREGFNRYTILYLDEIERIINYCKENNEPHVEKVLLLFAYYRINIFRKKLGGTADYAEIYADYFTNIARKTSMTNKTVVWATDILEKVKLIVHVTPNPRRVNGKWRTDKTVFVNYEKRNNTKLLLSGADYYKAELKKAQLQISEGTAHEKYEDAS